MKTYKKLIIGLLLMILIIGAGLYWNTKRNINNCDAVACASGDKCVAPNDALVNCEKLRQNPTKTDWIGNE